MNTLRNTVIVAGLLVAAASFAEEQAETDAVKQAASEICLSAAQQSYGAAEIVSSPKKRRIGRTKGYGFKLEVGEKGKKVNCVASSDGATMFYTGSL
jgi:hypothetical protein